ncbi:hypothetical protein GW796_07430 [archaeon]|nr:hypothetical protein [archaeon]NCQ51714.1 hypothetical protein [archaeon]
MENIVNKQLIDIATRAGLQPFEDLGPRYVAMMENFAMLIIEKCIQIDIEHFDTSPGNKIREFFEYDECADLN